MTTKHNIYNDRVNELAAMLNVDDDEGAPLGDPVDEAGRLNDFIRRLDDLRTRAVQRRAFAIRKGLDNGVLSKDFAQHMDVNSSRVFGMVRQGEHHAAK